MRHLLWVLLMALNYQVGTLTIPGGTGNADLTLPANFDPKAIRLWTTFATTDGSGADGGFAVGVGTYRGGAVQQFFMSCRPGDGLADMEVHTSWGVNSLLHWGDPPISTSAAFNRAAEIDLVSMTSGASSKVTINWVDLPPGGTRIHYEVWGGSAPELSDAYVTTFNVTTAATTQDVTVVAGFGQPDLVCLLTPQDGTTARETGAGATTSSIGIGWFKSATTRFFSNFRNISEGTAGEVAGSQQQKALIAISGTAILFTAEPSAVGDWPTDGFELTYSTTPATAFTVGVLALKGTFQSALGVGAAPIVGTPPVTQNLAAGFGGSTIRGLALQGWNNAASAAIVNSGAAWGNLCLGAGDGTTEGCSGHGNDDGANTIESRRRSNLAKVFQNYESSGHLLTSECDHSFSGDNAVLSWNDIDTVACEYQYLIVGDAAAAAGSKPYPRPQWRFPARRG